jgi:DNA binding domain, excisionase family
MTYMAFLQQTALTPMFFTVAQAAAVLNLSEKTVRRLLERGILHSSKAIRKKLIPREDIETFFDRTR